MQNGLIIKAVAKMLVKCDEPLSRAIILNVVEALENESIRLVDLEAEILTLEKEMRGSGE